MPKSSRLVFTGLHRQGPESHSITGQALEVEVPALVIRHAAPRAREDAVIVAEGAVEASRPQPGRIGDSKDVGGPAVPIRFDQAYQFPSSTRGYTARGHELLRFRGSSVKVEG